MTGRLPQRPVERYSDHGRQWAKCSTRAMQALRWARFPSGRYGGLAYRGERYGELPLPPRGAPSRSARALR